MTDGVSSRVIFAVSFLGIFSVLVMLMGSSFSSMERTNRLIEVPDYIDSSIFFADNVTIEGNCTLNYPDQEFIEMEDSDHEIEIEWMQYGKEMFFVTYRNGVKLWIIPKYERVNPHPLTWNNILDAYIDDANTSKIMMYSDSAEWTIHVYYNQTAYDNITHSYDNDELFFNIGKTNDLSASTLSAWGFLMSILTWNNPDIHPAVNFLIGLPLYAMFGIVLFYMFTRLWEAVKIL